MKTTLPFAQYDKETNSLHILHKHIPDGVSNLYLEGQADLFCYNQGFNDGLAKGIDVTTPQTELNAGGEPVKNATYWKRQYNLMASQNDNLKSGLYHANEQIKYLESTPQTKPEGYGKAVPLSDEDIVQAKKVALREYYAVNDCAIVETPAWFDQLFARAIESKIRGEK
jgi:hypothetical protein